MDENVDYKELYFKMLRASEKAVNILIRAQLECEELYLAMTEEKKDTKLILLPSEENREKTGG